MGGNGASEIDVRAELLAARRDLVTVLEGLEPGDWDKPTLCEGWRVRDVASHVAQTPHLKVSRLVGGLMKARGNADRMIDERARAGGARSHDEILAELRSTIDDTHVPAATTVEKMLVDTVVHSLDICHPNGWTVELPVERLRWVLSTLASLSGLFRGKERCDGLHLDTTDIDWRNGCGDHVRGPANVMLLALAGRPVCDQLSGAGVPTIAER